MDNVEWMKGERKRMKLQFGFHQIDVVNQTGGCSVVQMVFHNMIYSRNNEVFTI
jgi:hypothetical protein